jgi:N-acetylmuramic acid 6-phosphate etherase
MKARTSSVRSLKTEKQNPASAKLDTMSALEIAALMNREDAKISAAIKKALPQIAAAIELITRQLGAGGRLIYVGSGTSGRVGALDAAECPPTFGTHPKMVQFVIAGGEKSLGKASEANEDSSEQGRTDIARKKPGKRDVVVGIAASGRTPYTVGAVEYAREKGAATIAIVCNSGSALAKTAEVAIEVEVGPEVLSGSTRLKAGTAQKMICNMLTTGAMARLGYVYGNLMVNIQLKNEKLVERGISIVQSMTGVDREQALSALQRAGMKVPEALVMLEKGVGRAEATKRLKNSRGNLRGALEG